MYLGSSGRVSVQGGIDGAELRGREIISGAPITLFRAIPSGYNGLWVYDLSGANPKTVWNNGNMPFEQGTFTPSLTGSTGAPSSVSYTSRHGHYLRIGNMVWFNLYMNPSGYTGGSGNIRIGGLPFNFTTGVGRPNAFAVRVSTITWASGNAPHQYPIADGIAGSDRIAIYRSASGSSIVEIPLSAVPGNSGSSIAVSGAYMVA